jgi:putative tryptophan/tyrosine transport system substrate-binding protein
MSAAILGREMRRRDFIKVIAGSAAALPLAARAQQTAMPVIGYLQSASPSYFAQFSDAVRQGLNEIGYVEGQNVVIERRSAEGQYDRLAVLAADLVDRQVAVILAAGGTDPAKAAKAATSNIPIVFVSAADPVRTGLVASLNRPGGNVTGVSLLASALDAKKLGLLRELAPKASTIGVLTNPDYPSANSQREEAQQAAARLGLRPVMLSAGADGEIDLAFASAAKQGADALLVATDPFLLSRRERLVALAARYAVPAIYAQREVVSGGGLISYGPHFWDGYRQAGAYVGRVLKGEKPADLPVLQPTKFELVINLKTAKALGLEVPDRLLALADEVIE